MPIADIIAHFIEERLPPKPGSEYKPFSRPNEILKYMEDLLEWWGDKTVDEITKENCRKFTETCRSPLAARNRLDYLRNAVNQAHADGVLRAAVKVTLPPKAKPREEFLERDEVAMLLWKAWRHRRNYTHNATKSADTGLAGRVVATSFYPWRHVCRYVLIALYTGTRKDRIVRASFVREEGKPWIDLRRGEYHRAAPGEVVAANKRAPTIRIPRRLLAHMRRWYDKGARYPIEYNGEQVIDVRAFSSVKNAVFGEQRKVVGHTLRHTAATWLMRQPELSIHDISGFLGMSLEVLERVYGKHRTHHQTGIDLAMTRGHAGRDKYNVDGYDGWSYQQSAPTVTDRMTKNETKPAVIPFSKRSMKSKKAA
ncbi:integrase [Rhizobium sp. 1399]|nr:integrase [Rhizobium sp. BK456]MDR6663983.1 integrase [Rhizobium sp. 1399]